MSDHINLLPLATMLNNNSDFSNLYEVHHVNSDLPGCWANLSGVVHVTSPCAYHHCMIPSNKNMQICSFLLTRIYLFYVSQMLIALEAVSYVNSALCQPNYICLKFRIYINCNIMHNICVNVLKFAKLNSSCFYSMLFIFCSYFLYIGLGILPLPQAIYFALDKICRDAAHWRCNTASVTSNNICSNKVKVSKFFMTPPHILLRPHVGGGGSVGLKHKFNYKMLQPYVLSSPLSGSADTQYKYMSHISYERAKAISENSPTYIVCRIPLECISPYLSLAQANAIAKIHGVFIPCRSTLSAVISALIKHRCSNFCYNNVFVFNSASAVPRHYVLKKTSSVLMKQTKIVDIKSKQTDAFKKRRVIENKRAYQRKQERKHIFPPSSPSNKHIHNIINGFHNDTHPSNFEEAGCAVCGMLTPLQNLINIDKIPSSFLDPLKTGLAKIERRTANDVIQEFTKPVIDSECHSVCKHCHRYLEKNQAPPMALANGLWLGKIPKELSNLTFVEKLLISRVRHNRCVVKVASGRYKLRANAINFQNPIPKIYDTLPPPLEELDQVLACMFTGPCQPTKKDIERTPLLVRRNEVGNALRWLKLNHADYQDMEISEYNLNQYPLKDTPVVIDYRESIINRDREAMSIHDNDEEEGVETGDCPFVVHGITGEEFTQLSLETLKIKAMEHLMKDGKIMFVGHAPEPESIYNNPQLFPSMMPWLFPYGKGGICNRNHSGKLSSLSHKKRLLMYHDKRFQTDPCFPLIAFNHEQIQQCSLGSYLTAEKSYFNEITERLFNIDLNVLSDISQRLQQGIRVRPETEAEQLCYKLVNDLDLIGGHVKGSLATKKHMRNEIWSMISHLGTPSWFVTLSPADNKHPICLYFADMNEQFKPEIRTSDDAYRLIANNPVAAARFFDFMCCAFIKNVLGVCSTHSGLFGDTAGYYGTVEQQGRLTLHMHILIWLKNSLSPQEIRDKIMDRTSDFQQQMVRYLESVHRGEFFNGRLADVSQSVAESEKNESNYIDPTKTMPEPPPLRCKKKTCNNCIECIANSAWQAKFEQIVDDIVLRSNVHKCRMTVKDKHGNDVRKGCLNKQGNCKARFPREVREQTTVDPLSGALRIKKGEAWINMFTPVITYLFRCNTDTTSLLSGTAVKAIVAYVSDYITKPGLTTYSMFDSIRHIFDRSGETIMTEAVNRKQAAKKLITKMVNSLTSKMEIGSPMASLYLLGNPDHYTGHNFVTFYWKMYVHEIQNIWNYNSDKEKSAKVILNKNLGKIVGVSKVHDYMYRPHIYKKLSLYDWIKLVQKKKRSKIHRAEHGEERMKEGKHYDNDMLDNDTDTDELDILKNKNTVLYTTQCGGGEIDMSEDELDILNNNIDKGDCFEDTNEQHEFLSSHPQYETHYVQYHNNDNVVPNFVGGSLPRSDQGDREYYCLTMLTLFKPWRTGKELKSETDTWDEAFLQHKFTTEEIRLMRNFNLRYECADARDDYSAKLKRNKETEGLFPSWAATNILKDLDENTIFDYNDDESIDIEIDDSIYMEPSSTHIKRLNEMNTIENIVRNAGWLDKCTGTVKYIDPVGFIPDLQITGNKWSTIIKTAKDAVLAMRGQHLPVNENGIPLNTQSFNTVTVQDIGYLRRNFKAEIKENQNTIEETVTGFMLNIEQERAFRIVANHATMAQPSQLKMYLGGMGGTGKSQVIKALITFFEKRKESHRIIILAPTGSAAALLNGSTYHSILKVNVANDKKNPPGNEHSAMALVKSRLDGVNYIFLDEVSMLSCHDLYKISAQIAKARNIMDVPFGGINMIFAGDFAQLPPVGGDSLYSGSVGTSVQASQTARGQQSAIGKALWHQVTTVVILRQNMRQKTQTPDDAKLRKALENMRYAACTPQDLAYLRSRIAGRDSNRPRLAEQKYRNVPIITALNVQKDKINQLGSERFAAETGQTLVSFYSVDHFGEEEDPSKEKKRMGKKRTLNNGEIPSNLQNILWNLRHSACDHIPGKLSLCIGLPVMIRHNEATELCITKGQEGHVVGWQAAIGPQGQNMLDTLFVKLDKPARPIQLEGLPENIVPLTKLSTSINCATPSDVVIKISRSQVPVLPNFAMTDYASQGKTREVNVVDLNSCRSHMAYYTALSRSATSEGTVIVQGFDDHKISCKISGYLRQEFRELELLDEITKLAYENMLPNQINGNLRNALIRQFQIYRGTEYIPPNVPNQLKWTLKDPMDLLPNITYSPWQVIKSTGALSAVQKKENNIADTRGLEKNTFVAAKGTTSVENKLKRKANEEVHAGTSKRIKTKKSYPQPISPVGLIWDSNDWSCAYDAIFTVLYEVWMQNPTKWSKWFSWISNPLKMLAFGFNEVVKGEMRLENARDNVRNMLYEFDQTMFPKGANGTSIPDLAKMLMNGTESLCYAKIKCTICKTEVSLNPPDNLIYIHSNARTVNGWFQTWQRGTALCNTCHSLQNTTRGFLRPPEILMFSIDSNNVAISKTVKVAAESNGKVSIIPLKGIIYLKDFHFTSRLISNKDVWFHDGQVTKNKCKKEGSITDFDDRKLKQCNNAHAVLAIYAKV